MCVCDVFTNQSCFKLSTLSILSAIQSIVTFDKEVMRHLSVCLSAAFHNKSQVDWAEIFTEHWTWSTL